MHRGGHDHVETVLQEMAQLTGLMHRGGAVAAAATRRRRNEKVLGGLHDFLANVHDEEEEDEEDDEGDGGRGDGPCILRALRQLVKQANADTILQDLKKLIRDFDGNGEPAGGAAANTRSTVPDKADGKGKGKGKAAGNRSAPPRSLGPDKTEPGATPRRRAVAAEATVARQGLRRPRPRGSLVRGTLETR
jgi:hypothetical protein